MRNLLPILLTCASLLILAPRLTPALAQDAPLVLAFYYAWYDLDSWSADPLSDHPVLPYASDDAPTIERHVAQAQEAGIDALIQSWYGPREADNQTEANFRALLDVAAGKGFHAAVDFETTGPFFPDQASVADALHTLLSTHAQHPAYLRYQGKPVIFFWKQDRFSVEEWAAIRSRVDPGHDSLWIAEGLDAGYLDVFDGHHLYSVAWSSDAAQTLTDWGNRIRRYQRENNSDRLWVATVMPGYDDTGAGRDNAFAVDRQDGGYYRDVWTAAVASQPNWIVITSFNEWLEGTMIEPSVTYGNLYLDLTREQSTQFKGMPPPAEAPTSALTPAQPSVRADETVRIRSGPGTQYERIGRLRQGDSAAVVGQNPAGTWWQIRLTDEGTAGGPAWVTAEFVTFEGDADTVPIIESQMSTFTPPPAAIVTPRPVTQSPTVPPSTSRPHTPTPSPTGTLPATLTLPPTPTWLFTTVDSVTSTLMPAPATAQPTVSQTRVAQDSSSLQPTGTLPSPSPTSMMRHTPGQRNGNPSVLLWIGIGSLLGAGSLVGIVWRTTRKRRK